MTDMGMIALAIATSSNTLAIMAAIFKAGRYVQRQEQTEARVQQLEDSKTDVSLARLEEQVSGVREAIDSMQREMRRIGEQLMGRKAATAGD